MLLVTDFAPQLNTLRCYYRKFNGAGRRRKKYRPFGYRFCALGYEFYTRVNIDIAAPEE